MKEKVKLIQGLSRLAFFTGYERLEPIQPGKLLRNMYEWDSGWFYVLRIQDGFPLFTKMREDHVLVGKDYKQWSQEDHK